MMTEEENAILNAYLLDFEDEWAQFYGIKVMR